MEKIILKRTNSKKLDNETGSSGYESIEGLNIPLEAYKEFKRCPKCQSVFIDDNKCEACGRTLNFRPIGEALGPKSIYGLKEKYVENLPAITRYFNSMESKQSSLALNYKRHLNKRFLLLLGAFNEGSITNKKDRRLFFGELKDLISEEIEMEVSVSSIEAMIEKELGVEHILMTQELLIHLHQEAKLIANKDLLFGVKKTFLLKTLLALVIFSFISFIAVFMLVS